ncbi:MAG: ABC transporter permease [Lachnospiraceae bacterium]|jgi:putative ABC transport system permease protein|nr:ABC transporter permease [Lachnospiraceae bacterium]
MKIIDLLRTANRNLLSNKKRTILTVIAIFVGTFTIALTVAINNGASDYINEQVKMVGDMNTMIISPKTTATSSEDGPTEYVSEKTKMGADVVITKDNQKSIANIKYINSVEAVKNAPIDYIEGKNGKKYVLDSGHMAGITPLEDGEQLDEKSSEPQLLILPTYVKALGYKNNKDIIGKNVRLQVSSSVTKKSQIVIAKVMGVRSEGIINPGVNMCNTALIDKAVSISEEGLPASMKNNTYGVTAQMKENVTDKQIQYVKDKLDKMGYEGITLKDQVKDIMTVLDAITMVLMIFAALSLFAASFGIINTLYMSVQDRTREIGLMKAFGMSKRKISWLFSFEAIYIGFWGSLIGVLAATGAGKLLNAFSKANMNLMSGYDITKFSIQPILIIMGVIMLIAFLAGTFPARRASKLDPIKALSYE